MSKNPSKIAIKSNARSAVITLLNARLADAIDLALATKQAHWNLKGIQFIAIHEMLDGFRAGLDEHVDTMAERVAQLGGQALGTLQAAATSTALKPYPADITRIKDHLAELTERYAALANAVRTDIDNSSEAGDADTADILTGFSRMLDKSLWFLQSHQE